MAGNENKALVVYDSLFGNTRKIAEAIKEGLDNQYDSKLMSVKDVKLTDINSIQLLILGSPTHGGRYSEAVKAFFATLRDDSLEGIRASSFDTSIPVDGKGWFIRLLIKMFGYAAPRISRELTKKGASIVSSETFWVLDREGPLKDGETERARSWAAGLV